MLVHVCPAQVSGVHRATNRLNGCHTHSFLRIPRPYWSVRGQSREPPTTLSVRGRRQAVRTAGSPRRRRDGGRRGGPRPVRVVWRRRASSLHGIAAARQPSPPARPTRHRHAPRRRTRGHPHDGESLVRRPLRSPRPRRRAQGGERRHAPQLQPRARQRLHPVLPHAEHRNAGRLEDRPGLERVPFVLGPRHQHGIRPHLRSGIHGSLHVSSAPVLLLAGVPLPDRRPLLLVGDGADVPQSPVPDRRHRARQRGDRRQRHLVQGRAQRHYLRPPRLVQDQLEGLLPRPADLRAVPPRVQQQPARREAGADQRLPLRCSGRDAAPVLPRRSVHQVLRRGRRHLDRRGVRGTRSSMRCCTRPNGRTR